MRQTFRFLWISACFLFYQSVIAQIQVKQLDKTSSFRGIAVHPHHKDQIWISGTKGTIGKSIDGGTHWEWISPEGFEKMDFRDIEVLNDSTALILSAGSPAIILKTTNSGKSWKKVYEDNRPDIFLDGFDFSAKGVGYAFGDPIQHRMQILKTIDFGENWKDISEEVNILMDPNEAAFAASGTSIRVIDHRHIAIVTGGASSHVYWSKDAGKNWQKYKTGILSGKSSQGAFSIGFKNKHTAVIVGGDYLMPDQNGQSATFNIHFPSSRFAPSTLFPAGFRSAVQFVVKNTWICTGTSGTDISYDNGKNWQHYSDEGFHAIATDPKGQHIYLTGDQGKFGIISFRSLGK